MERCLPADALNEDDNPNIIKTYPEISFEIVEEEEESLLNGNDNAQGISSPNINISKKVNKAGAATVRPKQKAVQKINRTGAATSRESKCVEANDRLKPEETRSHRGALPQPRTRLADRLPQGSMLNTSPPGPRRVTWHNPPHGVTGSSDHRHEYAARSSSSNNRYNLRSRC